MNTKRSIRIKLFAVICITVVISVLIALICTPTVYAETSSNIFVSSSEDSVVNMDVTEKLNEVKTRGLYEPTMFFPTCSDNNGYEIDNYYAVQGKKTGTYVNSSDAMKVTMSYDGGDKELIPVIYDLDGDGILVENNYNLFEYENIPDKFDICLNYIGDGGKTLISDDTWKNGVEGIDAFNKIRIGKGKMAYRRQWIDNNGVHRDADYELAGNELFDGENKDVLSLDKYQGELFFTVVYEVYQYNGWWHYWNIRIDYELYFRSNNDKVYFFDNDKGEIQQHSDGIYYAPRGFTPSIAGDKYGKMYITQNGRSEYEVNCFNEDEFYFDEPGVYEIIYENGYGNTHDFTVVVESDLPVPKIGDLYIEQLQKIKVNGSEYYYIRSDVIDWDSYTNDSIIVTIDDKETSKGKKLSLSDGIHTIKVKARNGGPEVQYYVYMNSQGPSTNKKMLNSSTYYNQINRWNLDGWSIIIDNEYKFYNDYDKALLDGLLAEIKHLEAVEGASDLYIYQGQIYDVSEYEALEDFLYMLNDNVKRRIKRLDLTNDRDVNFALYSSRSTDLYLNDYMFVKGNNDIDTQEIRYYWVSIYDYRAGRYDIDDIRSALKDRNANTHPFEFNKTMEQQSILDKNGKVVANKNGVYFMMEYNAIDDKSEVFQAIYVTGNQTDVIVRCKLETGEIIEEMPIYDLQMFAGAITSFEIIDIYNPYDPYATVQVFKEGYETNKDIYIAGDTYYPYSGAGLYIIRMIDRNGNVEEFGVELFDTQVDLIGVDDSLCAYGQATVIAQEDIEFVLTTINGEMVNLQWVYHNGTKSAVILRESEDVQVCLGYIDREGNEQYIVFDILA